MAVPLSEATRQRVERLFSGADVVAAKELLERDCADNIAGVPGMCDIDRIRFAALKLSDGSIAGLVDAIVMAQTDFRDALVAAEFAEDVDAHISWWPE